MGFLPVNGTRMAHGTGGMAQEREVDRPDETASRCRCHRQLSRRTLRNARRHQFLLDALQHRQHTDIRHQRALLHQRCQPDAEQKPWMGKDNAVELGSGLQLPQGPYRRYHRYLHITHEGFAPQHERAFTLGLSCHDGKHRSDEEQRYRSDAQYHPRHDQGLRVELQSEHGLPKR